MLRLRHVVAAALLLPVAAGAQNVALNMPTFSSPAYSPNSTAPNAVDGNTDGNFYNNSIFHSAVGSGGWWYVDLGQTYDVTQIDLWNRTDCCTTRIVGSTLGLFTAAPYQGGSPAPVWSTVIASAATQQTFNPNAVGRYVGIVDPVDYLQIAEVQVQGTPSVTPPGTTTPEPATWSLLAGGLLAIGGAARRRRVG